MSENEAALTTTIKFGGGKDDPWIVLRSRDAAHLQSQLLELGDGSAATTLGQVTEVVAAHYRIGKNLDAKPLSPQPSSAPAAPAPTPAQQPPAQAQAPQQQAPQQPPVQQDQAPQQGFQQQPPMQQPPAQLPQQWGNEQIPQQGFQQPQAPMQQNNFQPQGQAPQAQAPSAFAATPPVPNAPMILGQPARFQQGSSNGRPWTAFFDPRPSSELAKIPVDPATNKRPQTDDPNHPGLQGGTHEFVLWMR